MTARVVVGSGPVARAIARRLATRGSVVLASAEPVSGPWLWRRADPASGQGLRPLLDGAPSVHVVPEAGEPVDGALLLLGRATRVVGALVHPLELPRPKATPAGLSTLRHGPAWGPDEPLCAAWARQLVAGERVWTADPGPIRPVPMDALVAAALHVAEQPGRAWTLAGPESVRLDDLVDALARGLGVSARRRRVPLTWAAWAAGVSAERLVAWTRVPDAVTACDGWIPPTTGRAAWLGDPAAFRPGRADTD